MTINPETMSSVSLVSLMFTEGKHFNCNYQLTLKLGRLFCANPYSMYRILSNKRTVHSEKNWAIEKCQSICCYKHTSTFVSLDNKVTV